VAELSSLTALGAAVPRVVEIGGFRIVERDDVALASIAVRRGREKDVAKAAKTGKVPLPGAGVAVEGRPFGAFWMTPEMWMVEADYGTHGDIVAALKPMFEDAASITEQTDAWVRFDVSGDLELLLARLCNVDFSIAPDGFATRTVMEHTGVYLIRRGAGEVTIYGPRSSAHSLLHAIEVAAASVG
jgi:sarcosine oxidase, subunit gamma